MSCIPEVGEIGKPQLSNEKNLVVYGILGIILPRYIYIYMWGHNKPIEESLLTNQDSMENLNPLNPVTAIFPAVQSACFVFPMALGVASSAMPKWSCHGGG